MDSDGIFEIEDKGSVALEIAIKEIADITLWGESYGVCNLIDKSKSFTQLLPSMKCQHSLDAMNKSFNISGHRYHFGQRYIDSVKTYLRALNGLEPSTINPRAIFAYVRGKYNWSLPLCKEIENWMRMTIAGTLKGGDRNRNTWQQFYKNW